MFKKVPERVQLREERMWIAEHWSTRDPQTDGQWLPYAERPDPDLLAILAAAETPADAIRGWFKAAKPFLTRDCTPHLIPGQIQRAARLPVRQVYVHDGAVYRIEADGRVTDRLV